MTNVKKGDKVKVEYTGKFSDGEVFDKSEGRGPLCFEVGAKQVVPGFDQAIEGMELNKEKTFTLKPEEAYGEIRAELVQEVPRDKLPKEPEPKEGMMLMMSAPTGQQIPARITKVTADKVTIDINHPLAGKELIFTVKVVGVNEPEEAQKSADTAESDEKEDSGCGDSCSSCAGCQ